MTCHVSPLKLTGPLSTRDRLPHTVGIALCCLTQLPLLAGAALIVTRSPSTAFYLLSLIVSSPPVGPLSLTEEPNGSFQRASSALLPHTAKSSPGSCQCQYRTHPAGIVSQACFPSSALSLTSPVHSWCHWLWSTMKYSPPGNQKPRGPASMMWRNGRSLILENNYYTNQWYRIKLTIQSKFVFVFVF